MPKEYSMSLGVSIYPRHMAMLDELIVAKDTDKSKLIQELIEREYSATFPQPAPAGAGEADHE
jgi:hypothetical protein